MCSYTSPMGHGEGQAMRVGKYNLIAPLKTDGQGGGMEEIWLAHLDGPHGIRDTVILKRLLVESPHMKESLITEARLGMKLKHPNIGRTTDAFEWENQLWIAQEYVEGVNGDEIWKTLQSDRYRGRLT